MTALLRMPESERAPTGGVVHKVPLTVICLHIGGTTSTGD